jgi:PTH2 family peptidyl-tRNA hydrolase
MSPGKLSSQAGHAYLGAFVTTSPDKQNTYHAELPASPGTKVCLKAKNLDQILRAKDLAAAAGIPHFLVVDSGCANFFDGQPVITALGIGPATKAEVHHITKKFQLL